MEEQVNDLETSLKAKVGDNVRLTYVDVESDEMKNYPKIPPVLSNIRLPLIVVNDEPRFYGGLSSDMVAKVVQEVLSGEKKE